MNYISWLIGDLLDELHDDFVFASWLGFELNDKVFKGLELGFDFDD